MRIQNYDEGWFARQSPTGLAIKLVGAGLALAVLLCGAAWVFGWGKTAADVVGPDNVKAQWAFAYEYDNSLTGIATNWCSFKKAELASIGNSDEHSQRVSMTLAQETLYASKKAEYDAALRNAFKAKLVKPADVPTSAPTLDEKIAVLGLDCEP